MKEQSPTENPQNKPYQEPAPNPLDLTFEEEFRRNFAAGLIPDVFLQRMYKRINAWDWDNAKP
jgi:hypothetical protein